MLTVKARAPLDFCALQLLLALAYLKRKARMVVCLCLVFSLYPLSSNGQAIDQFDTKKGFTLGGSLGFSSIAYAATGIDSRRDPFDFYLTGNLNVGLFGYSFPFTFQYSNRTTTYTQPFNSFQFAPSYKWAKLYLGTASMSFSSYTLAGHQFNGVGVELTPGKWTIAAMYGRLKRAIEPDFDNPERGEPSYKRIGYGTKVGYTDDWGNVGVSFFAASDRKSSIMPPPPEAQLSPLSNVAVGITAQKNFFKQFYVTAEYTFSILHKESNTFPLGNTETPAELVKQATKQYFDVIAGGVGYQNKWMGLQLRYERVAPDYQTLGGYYFTNDMENYTIMPMLKLMDGKLSISGNIGFQRDNLNDMKGADTKRFVGAANATYVPNEKWNFTGAYSNFNSYTRHRLQEDPTFRDELDSLNFYQLSQSFNAGAGYNFGSKDLHQSIMLNLAYQVSSEEQKANPDLGGSDIYTGNVSYTFALTPSNLSMSVSGNFTHSSSPSMKSLFVGPSATLSKGWFKNVLRSSLGVSYSHNSTTANGIDNDSSSLSSRLNLNFSPKTKQKWGKHNAGVSFALMDRFGSGNVKSFHEFTTTINYTYSF